MRERDIFIEALAKDSEAELATYLNATCGGDQELRGRVERLLVEHQRQGPFILDAPRPAPAPAGGMAETSDGAGPEAAATAAGGPPPEEHPGTVIGRYKLLERIGEGGMGVVFMAQQHHPVRRKVALKVIKAGMDTRQVVARFEAERQALALMDHPNIAKVLDGGSTDSGRPYFVMELVQGVPITEYCDRHHLSPDDRLALFLPVCRAVQHAHAKGVIHRDLKPSNVLVALADGVPVPKVIDFGIAKATGQELTDKTLFTQFAQMVGTPLYMSPEQAAGGADVDTRSDVYSLGVLLYELLTGSTPFDRQRLGKAAFDEVKRIIRDEEPPKPSTRIGSLTAEALTVTSAHRKTSPRKLGGVVRGELDWIVMRALEKDRTRRYETAIGLAQDVERYLADQPVHASPPSAAYRLRKFARRNKGPVLAAALVLLALLGGVAGTAWQAVRAERARAAAVTALTAETAARQAETAARERAMAALESMTDDVVEQQLAAEPVLSEASRAFLRKIAAHYEALAAVQGDTPESRYTRATGHWRANLGGLLESSGERDDAQAAYRRAIEGLTELAAARRATPEDRAALANARRRLGALLSASGNLPDAEVECRAALDLQQGLAAEFPAAPDHRVRLAADHGALGLVLENLKRRPDAEAAYRQAIRLDEELVAQFPTGAAAGEHAVNLGGAYCNLGRFVGSGDEPSEALEWWQRAFTTLTPLATRQSPPPSARQFLRNSHWSRAPVLERLGQFEQALRDWDAAVTLTEQLEPGPGAAPMFAGRAELLTRLGRLDDALADHDRAVEADPANHWYWMKRACLQAYARRDDAYRADCLQMLEKFGGTDQREVGERVAKACLLADPPVGDPAVLARLIEQALAPGVPDHFLPWFRMSQGIARYRAGNHASAVESLTAARSGMTDPTPLATADAFLAMAYHKLKRPDEAREAAARGAALAEAGAAEIDNPDGRSPLKSGDNDWLYYLVVRRQADAATSATAAPLAEPRP